MLIAIQVLYRTDNIQLDLVDLSRADGGLVQSHGGSLSYGQCEDGGLSLMSVNFRSEESSIRLPNWSPDSPDGGTVQFHFVTNEPNGLVMYGLGASATTDFFGLEILDGQF